MYYAYVRYVADRKSEIVPQTRVKHLDGEKFSPENDVDFELTKLYLVKWTGESGSSGDEDEEAFYEARVLNINKSLRSLKEWVRSNCEERRLALKKIPFSPEPRKTAASRAEKRLANRMVSTEAEVTFSFNPYLCFYFETFH